MAIAVAMLHQLPRGLTSAGRHNAAPSWKAERYRSRDFIRRRNFSKASNPAVIIRSLSPRFATHLGLRRRSAFYTLSRPPRARIYATYYSKFYAI
jgi:hypothetical protein